MEDVEDLEISLARLQQMKCCHGVDRAEVPGQDQPDPVARSKYNNSDRLMESQLGMTVPTIRRATQLHRGPGDGAGRG